MFVMKLYLPFNGPFVAGGSELSPLPHSQKDILQCSSYLI